MFCSLGLISTLSFSQNPNSNPNAQKWQLNGNSTDTNKFVGTTNNVDLIFKRNNIEGFRLRQDTSANFTGDLVLNKFKIPPAPPKERFLKIDNLGKITSLDKSGLLKSIYTPGTTCISTGVNVGIPIWNATSTPTYGILFTGIDCPARVGIGTNNPVAMLDVRGGGHFTSVVGINNIPTPQNQLTINSATGRFVGLQLINNHPNGFPFTKYGIKNIVNNANTIAYSVTNQTTNEDVFRVMGDGTMRVGKQTATRIDFGHSNPAVTPWIKSYMGFNLNHNNTTDRWEVNNNSAEGSNGIMVTNSRLKFASIPVNALGGSSSFTNEDMENYIIMTMYNDPVPTNPSAVVLGSGTRDANFFVNGTIKSNRIEVRTTVWSDFVFDKEYSLKPLKEVENFIKENKHLPDVPSEKEVLENGIDLGEMDAILLRKIEELTLYMIGLKKDNELLQLKIKQLEEAK